MTATTRSTECSAPGATLMLAFELGSTKWTLGFTTAPRSGRACGGCAPGPARAGEGDPTGEDAVRAPGYSAGAELLRGGPGWILAPPMVDRARRGKRRGGFVEHRSQSAGAPREDGSAGCRQVVGAPAVARRGTQGLECGAPVAGGRSARQLPRVIATVREARKRVRNRIQSWLATQGLRLELRTGFVERLATVQTGDGRALPAAFRLRLAREWQRWTPSRPRRDRRLMGLWFLLRIVSQRSLLSCRLEFEDRRLDRASLFPLFDDEGRTRMVLITAEENGRIMLANWAPGLFVRDWALRNRLRLRFTDLNDASMWDEERFEDLWHFDPRWVLGDERYHGHGAVPHLRSTNIPGYDQTISGSPSIRAWGARRSW